MRYFTFQRILTFLTGIAFLYISVLSYASSNSFIHYGITIFLVILAIYIIIASLIPYKRTSKGVAEIVLEMLIQFMIEFIPSLIYTIIKTIAHLFSH